MGAIIQPQIWHVSKDTFIPDPTNPPIQKTIGANNLHAVGFNDAQDLQACSFSFRADQSLGANDIKIYLCLIADGTAGAPGEVVFAWTIRSFFAGTIRQSGVLTSPTLAIATGSKVIAGPILYTPANYNVAGAGRAHEVFLTRVGTNGSDTFTGPAFLSCVALTSIV